MNLTLSAQYNTKLNTQLSTQLTMPCSTERGAVVYNSAFYLNKKVKHIYPVQLAVIVFVLFLHGATVFLFQNLAPKANLESPPKTLQINLVQDPFEHNSKLNHVNFLSQTNQKNQTVYSETTQPHKTINLTPSTPTKVTKPQELLNTLPAASVSNHVAKSNNEITTAPQNQPQQNANAANNALSPPPTPLGSPNYASGTEKTTNTQRTPISIDATYSKNNPKPYYPPLARRLGEEGTVVLLILVGTDGRAYQIKMKQSSGSVLLDKAAEQQAKESRFNPATINGQPVDEWYEQPYVYNLKQ